MGSQHIAILLSTPKVPPARISSLIDVYFPDLNDGQAPEATSLLFIRMMSQDQLLMLRPYRQVVLGWYETALAAHRWVSPFHRRPPDAVTHRRSQRGTAVPKPV